MLPVPTLYPVEFTEGPTRNCWQRHGVHRAGAGRLNRSPRVSENSILPATFHRAGLLRLVQKARGEDSRGPAAALGPGPPRVLLPGGESSGKLRSRPLPMYPQTVPSLGQAELRRNPAHSPGQLRPGPPRPGHLRSPGFGYSPVRDLFASRSKYCCSEHERGAPAQFLTNSRFLRAPPGGSCPRDPALPRHPGLQTRAGTLGSAADQLRENKRVAERRSLAGGVSGSPAPRLPAAPLATNPGPGSGATSPHSPHRSEGGRRGNEKINGILSLPAFRDPRHTPQSILRIFLNFPPRPHPAPVATLGRATESRSTGRERWSKARHFPHHCGAGQSRELLRKTDSPSARPGSRGAANRARPGDRPPRPAGGSAAAPLPGPSSQNAAETKAERSPCCNSRGPGRERVPNRARRAQRRAGLEVDKILRPFHSHIKQTPFLCLKKKKKCPAKQA